MPTILAMLWPLLSAALISCAPPRNDNQRRYEPHTFNIAAACGVEKRALSGMGLREEAEGELSSPGPLVGHFSVYERDLLSAKRLDATINDLPYSGYLCNSAFLSKYDSVEDALFLAFGAGETLIFADDSIEFEFVLAFANANRMLAYYRSIHASLIDLPRVILRFSDKDSLKERGPFYANEDLEREIDFPTIVLPGSKVAGPQVLLKNLRTDFDVVAHELGHHVIAQHLPQDSMGAQIMHEALADFFVARRNGDACIARTVCSEGAEAEACYASAGWTQRFAMTM